MIPETFLDNLQSWAIQVFVIASIGALLPLIFRIRHPRSHLAYWHLLLAACLVLPAIQPWQHPIVLVSSSQPTAAPTAVQIPGAAAAAVTVIAGGQGILGIMVAGF